MCSCTCKLKSHCKLQTFGATVWGIGILFALIFFHGHLLPPGACLQELASRSLLPNPWEVVQIMKCSLLLPFCENSFSQALPNWPCSKKSWLLHSQGCLVQFVLKVAFKVLFFGTSLVQACPKTSCSRKMLFARIEGCLIQFALKVLSFAAFL